MLMLSARGTQSSTGVLPFGAAHGVSAADAARKEAGELAAALAAEEATIKAQAAMKAPAGAPAPVEHREELPPPPLRYRPSEPAVVYAPPSVEDLLALYQLCGGSPRTVVEVLARLWRTSPDAIRATVEGWLTHLPPIKPPSRSQSAPPVLAPALEARLKSVTPYRRAIQMPTVPTTVQVPAVSAPGRSSLDLVSRSSSSDEVVSRLRSFANRPRTEAQILTLPDESPQFVPVVLTQSEMAALPEDVPMDQEGFEVSDLAANFQARTSVHQDKTTFDMHRGLRARGKGMRF